MSRAGAYSADPRLRWPEMLPWAVALAAFFLVPDYLALGAHILIYILFALSLDLIVGYGGIMTLGHAAFFGLGAYTAGILASRTALTDPLIGLAAGGLAGGLFGFASGAVVLRTRGIALLMLTLAVSAILLAAANQANGLTGGADGLSGIAVAPLLGRFAFGLVGRTAYLYSLAVLFLGWVVLRRLVGAPFGAMLTGIRDNPARMEAIGAPVYRRKLLAYAISAALAGVAGALLAQVNQFVGLDVLGFAPSGEILVMLILGGVGRLTGAFLGPTLFLVAQDQLAKAWPEYWYLGVGLLLLAVVMFAPDGLLGLFDTLSAALARRGVGRDR